MSSKAFALNFRLTELDFKKFFKGLFSIVKSS